MSAALKLDLTDKSDRLFEQMEKSVPTLTELDPNIIPYQIKVIRDIKKDFDYSGGKLHEILLSGSVGSAKSILMAHLCVTHCLENAGAVALIGRKAMPNLKDTLLQMIIDHLGTDVKYRFRQDRGRITFANGSKILCYSWHDKNYKKVRSYALSAAFIEELTENKDDEFFKEIRMRLGRIPHIKESILMCATNPDSPGHWAYKYFIDTKIKTRHVYYSVTSDNPFLQKEYIRQLKETLTPREALRMLYGQWIEIKQEVIYYNYEEERNFLKETKGELVPGYPIDLMFDFNIGVGKPMSAALGQYINGHFHIYKDFVVDGARTMNICEEISDSDYLKGYNLHIRIFGDATGKNNRTSSIHSDYDIIDGHFQNLPNVLNYEKIVPLANPPIRKRHNLVNVQFLNDNGKSNLSVYKDAEVANDGFRFSKLKAGANLMEDDSDRYQHVSTAIGYYICSVKMFEDYNKNKSQSLMP